MKSNVWANPPIYNIFDLPKMHTFQVIDNIFLMAVLKKEDVIYSWSGGIYYSTYELARYFKKIKIKKKKQRLVPPL